jgi:non-ribosomal peptide synthetase component F
MTTVPALWHASVATRCDAPAVCVCDRGRADTAKDERVLTFSYRELAFRVSEIAQAVARHTPHGKRELVGVVADNGWALVAAMLGVMEAGHAYFPLALPGGADASESGGDAGNSEGGIQLGEGVERGKAGGSRVLAESLASLLSVAGSRCTMILCDTMLVAERVRGAVREAGLHHVVDSIDAILAQQESSKITACAPPRSSPSTHNSTSTSPVDAADSDAHAAGGSDGIAHSGTVAGPPCPSDPCWAFLTSGSTGARKLVVATHSEVSAYTNAMASRLGVCADTRWFVATSSGFDPNAGDTLMTLLVGGVVCAARWAETTLGLARCVRATGATAAGSTPAVWSLWGDDDPPAVFTVLTLGGETMPLALAIKWAPRVALWNLYGLTEVRD